MGSRDIRIKRVYGKPWSRMVEEGIPLDRKVLMRLGRIIVKAVVDEARVDFAKRGRVPHKNGDPQGIPDTESFFKSFHFRLVGASTIEVFSTWPYIDRVLEGRDPYPMTWLTRDGGGPAVVPIITGDGRVIFRATPLQTSDAWVHPGVARHTFLARGVKRGREEAMRVITEEVKKTLLKGDILL